MCTFDDLSLNSRNLSLLMLNKAESDKPLDFLAYNIHSVNDHYVRWKGTEGCVAMWDNKGRARLQLGVLPC